MSDDIVLSTQVPAPLAVAAAAADSAAAHGVFARYRAAKADQTLRAHDADLARWVRYLQAVKVDGARNDWANDPHCWADVSWGLVAGFVRWQEDEGYSLASVSRALSTVRTYARQAALAGALPTEALRLIELVTAASPRSKEGRNVDAKRAQTRRPEAKKATPVRITREQARRLKREHPATPEGRRDALLMCLLIDHGLRVSEVADLKVTDLDLAAGTMTFYRRKVDKTQTHRLEPDTLRAARRYVDAGEAPPAGSLLVALAHNRPAKAGMTTQAIFARVTALGKTAGLEGLSPHDCRHYAATLRARLFRDPYALQEWGGWSSIATPRRYVEEAKVANDRVYVGEED